jgi:hypothetical protein
MTPIVESNSKRMLDAAKAVWPLITDEGRKLLEMGNVFLLKIQMEKCGECGSEILYGEKINVFTGTREFPNGLWSMLVECVCQECFSSFTREWK